MTRFILAAALITTFGTSAMSSEAAKLISAAKPAVRSGTSEPLRLTESEYLAAPDLSVLAFHNHYAVGKQGGIEIIHQDQRIATNGDVVVLRRARGAERNVPSEPILPVEKPIRLVDRTRNTITVPFDYPDLPLKYSIVIEPEPEGFAVFVDLDRPLDPAVVDSLTFEMELYPGAFRGRSFSTEKDFGVLPWDFGSPVGDENGRRVARPLATGQRLVLAQDDPESRLEITSEGAPLRLLDGRFAAPHYWFAIAAEAKPGASRHAIALHLRPSRDPGWRRKPVIAHSQVGYHPAQRKTAVLELDPRTTVMAEAKLERLTADGVKTALASRPRPWGRYLRYEYATFDFSVVREPGLYRIRYGRTTTAPFRIAEDVYREGVWQPAIETFLPVQMCHMRVKDRGRLWHGACHLDDGVQAPAPLKFFDGYGQSERTQTSFAPETTIPGMNLGGWHDAGDDDINTGSTGRTAYHLALLAEEFGARDDQTTIDFDRREVALHQPDGKPDVLQQLAHGVRWLLAPYRVGEHSFVGVISHDWQTYLQAGDWAQQTDGLLFDPKLARDQRTGTRSGRADDRYVFTDEDGRTEYFVAGTLAASHRALRSFDPTLAEECLRVARTIWERQQAMTQPVVYPSVGTPDSLVEERTNAAVELFLATREGGFLDAIVRDQEQVLKEIGRTAWTVSRVETAIRDEGFRRAFGVRLADESRELAATLAKNPFGTTLEAQVWGYAWDILWKIYKRYYLVKSHPDLFPKEQLLDAVEYTLGRHPGSDLSLVSGVGPHRPIPAFGINRSDYGHIPGGVYSGVALIRPDFPELKDDHPFLWQQSEYIVFGATPYAFCVLAADKLLTGTGREEAR